MSSKCLPWKTAIYQLKLTPPTLSNHDNLFKWLFNFHIVLKLCVMLSRNLIKYKFCREISFFPPVGRILISKSCVNYTWFAANYLYKRTTQFSALFRYINGFEWEVIPEIMCTQTKNCAFCRYYKDTAKYICC